MDNYILLILSDIFVLEKLNIDVYVIKMELLKENYFFFIIEKNKDLYLKV